MSGDLVIIAGFVSTYFYCNSARLSYVVRCNGVFVVARFIVAWFHCISHMIITQAFALIVDTVYQSVKAKLKIQTTFNKMDNTTP